MARFIYTGTKPTLPAPKKSPHGVNLTGDNIGVTFDKYQETLEDRLAEIIKLSAKEVSIKALELIPITGSGFTAKKTTATTGKGKPTPSRSETKVERAKLYKRRGFRDSSADLQRTIKRVVGKINRMRNDVLVARVLSGRPVIKIVLGSYYSAAIRLKDRGNKTLPQAMREAINS